MTRLRARGFFAVAGVLAVLGVTLSAGLDPLLAGPDQTGSAGTAGHALILLAGASALFALMLVEPAWPLSLAIAAMVFSGNWELLGSPLPLDRILVAAGVLSLILRARRIRDVIGRDPVAIHWLLLAATLFGLLSAAFAGTIDDRDAIFALLDRFGVVPFVLFAVAPAAFPDERRRRILLGTLTAVGAYLVYISLMARLGPASLVIPHYVTDPSVGIHADRARGPFLEAGGNGLALFECGVAAAYLWATEIDSKIRAAAALVVVGAALCIVLTETRAIWIASAIAIPLTMVTADHIRRLAAPAIGALLVLVVGGLAVIPGLRAEVSERESDERSIWDRENANAAAVRMIAERPLAGFGWFQFGPKSPPYQRLSDNHIITRSGLEEHNVFLSNAVELGLVGTAVWGIALLVAVLGAIVRRGPPDLYWWRIGLIAIAVQWFVVANFVPLGYAFPNAVLWLWAGVTSWRPASEIAAQRAGPPPRWTPRALRPTTG